MPPATRTVGTDGSCLKNPGGATGWAWVCNDGTWASGGMTEGTNQVGELYAVLAALRDFPTGNLIVHTDSAYALNAATIGAQFWSKNGWRTKAGTPVANAHLVKMVMRLMTTRRHPVRFVKVPGHDTAGRWPLNTAADQRAGEAARWAQMHRAARDFAGTGRPFEGPLAPPEVPVESRRSRPVATQRGPLAVVYCTSCNGPLDANGNCRCSM